MPDPSESMDAAQQTIQQSPAEPIPDTTKNSSELDELARRQASAEQQQLPPTPPERAQTQTYTSGELSGSWEELHPSSVSTTNVQEAVLREGNTLGISAQLSKRIQGQESETPISKEKSGSGGNTLEEEVLQLTSVLEAMQSKIFDLEASKEQQEKVAREEFARTVAMNTKLLEDRKFHMDMMAGLKEDVEKLRAEKEQRGREEIDKEQFDKKTPDKDGKGKTDSYAWFVTKFAEHFPQFDPKKAEVELGAWESYWESVTAFKRITNCSETTLAYLIKDSAAQGSELAVCLQDVGHEAVDGMVDINDLGLEGIKARMQEDFGPKSHHLAQQARVKYENTRRKFKERPKWFSVA